MESGDQMNETFEPQNRNESLIVSRLKEKYIFIRRLGKGAFATVYEVINRKLDRHEALKVLSSDLTADQEFLKRFVVEAKICASFTHPNIVTIYEFGRVQNFFYFTMLYVDGPPLSNFLEGNNDLSPKRICAIISDVAMALEYAHQQGVIHRDIKPQNIMLDKSKRPYITDFGIAKSDKGLTHTRTGLFMGSPHFVSPEQVKGEQVDCRADIYSLGVTLYALLTQQYPFRGDTAISIMVKRLTEEPISPIKYKPDLDPVLNEIIHRSLKKNLDQRYQSAREFAEDINSFLESKPDNSIKTEVFDSSDHDLSKLHKELSTNKLYIKTGFALLAATVVFLAFLFFSPFESGSSKFNIEMKTIEKRIQSSTLNEKEMDEIQKRLEQIRNLQSSTGKTDKIDKILKQIEMKRQKQGLAGIEADISGFINDIKREIDRNNYIRVKQISESAIDQIGQLSQKDQEYFKTHVLNFNQNIKNAENKIHSLKLEKYDQILNKDIALSKEAFDKFNYEECVEITKNAISIINASPVPVQKNLEDQLAVLNEIQKNAEIEISKKNLSKEEENFKKELMDLISEIEERFKERKYLACINAAIIAKSKIESLPQNNQVEYSSHKEKILGYQYRSEHAKEKRDSQLFTLKRIERLIEEGSLGSALSLIDNALVQPDIENDIEIELKEKRKEVKTRWVSSPQSHIDIGNIQYEKVVIPPEKIELPQDEIVIPPVQNILIPQQNSSLPEQDSENTENIEQLPDENIKEEVPPIKE